MHQRGRELREDAFLVESSPAREAQLVVRPHLPLEENVYVHILYVRMYASKCVYVYASKCTSSAAEPISCHLKPTRARRESDKGGGGKVVRSGDGVVGIASMLLCNRAVS